MDFISTPPKSDYGAIQIRNQLTAAVDCVMSKNHFQGCDVEVVAEVVQVWSVTKLFKFSLYFIISLWKKRPSFVFPDNWVGVLIF